MSYFIYWKSKKVLWKGKMNRVDKGRKQIILDGKRFKMTARIILITWFKRLVKLDDTNRCQASKIKFF